MLTLHPLTEHLGLGPLLESLRESASGYQLIDEWPQGEFHHDVVVRTGPTVLVISTNCNGGVKELQLFEDKPDRWTLWHHRCPENPEFASRAQQPLPKLLAHHRTMH